MAHEMDSMYENTSFMPSTVASGEKCSQYKGNSKVLLIVLAVCLVFALGGLCILGILYVNVSMQLSAQKTNNTIMKRQLEELTANCTRVREHLHINNTVSVPVMVRKIEELTANCTRVREHLHINNTVSVPVMVRKIEELTANYTRIREQLSFYEAFMQCLNCDMTLTTFKGKLYFFSSNEQNWSSSRAFCVSKGADLVTITSQSEQRFLVSKIEEQYWIGLNDLETEGHWVWVNNRTLNETGVQFWYQRESGKSEPDNWKQDDPTGENCAIINNLKSWSDVSCNYQIKFICEKKQAY